MNTSNYPIEAGYKAQGASEIAATIGEGILRVRPRTSNLVTLGIVVKGPTRPASICGRMAHVILPSDVLMNMIVQRELQLDGSDDDALWAAVGSMILDRIEEEKRRRRREAAEALKALEEAEASGAVEAMGPLKAPRSKRTEG